MRSKETLKKLFVFFQDINISTLKFALDAVCGGVTPWGVQNSVQF